MAVEATQQCQSNQCQEAGSHNSHPALALTCLLALIAYALLCDLKGVNTDEGLRLGIINGGKPFATEVSSVSWSEVLRTGQPFAYQPLYFLLQRTVMDVAQSNSVVLLKLVNIGFLWLSLQGLLVLSSGWRLLPRVFLLGVFSFNAYLLMHVLQIREYILGVSFYVWSTWLVLHLVDRPLCRPWRDTTVFIAYGVLLTLGFYVQTWVVFVAVAQALFMVIRRTQTRWRFYAHLALSYLIVLTATAPFLQANQQRVDVGRWGAEGTALWPQLSNGFHLVLSGHTAGHSLAGEFLFWFWPAVILMAALLMWIRPADTATYAARGAIRHQGLLMALSMALPFIFQIVYFYRVDNLSVWPRYFVIHYFFLFWLLALAFRYLYDLSNVDGLSVALLRLLRISFATIMAILAASAIWQVTSYYRDPFLDTGLSRTFNWRLLSGGVTRVLRPDDVLVVHEIINQSALTFTHPLPNRVLMLADLERTDLDSPDRLLYLESTWSIPHRAALISRMAALGYGRMQELPLPGINPGDTIPGWCLLAFER